MTDYTDLIARLRLLQSQQRDNDAGEAADALEAQARRIAELERQLEGAFQSNLQHCRLQDAQFARIAELEAALKPFVKVLEWNCEETAPDDWYLDNEGTLTVGILRAARAALEKK